MEWGSRRLQMAPEPFVTPTSDDVVPVDGRAGVVPAEPEPVAGWAIEMSGLRIGGGGSGDRVASVPAASFNSPKSEPT